MLAERLRLAPIGKVCRIKGLATADFGRAGDGVWLLDGLFGDTNVTGILGTRRWFLSGNGMGRVGVRRFVWGYRRTNTGRCFASRRFGTCANAAHAIAAQEPAAGT